MDEYELSGTDRRILAHLCDRVERGDRYFRAKRIADHIGLSAKQVGARLPLLAERTDELDVEKWGRARSTTWRVVPTS